MGKPTGFLEYSRKDNPQEAPELRIRNFNEFHRMLSVAERQTQAARCMDCGVPFCQSGMVLGGTVTGCPLNNLIPEWNDLLYSGNWEQALDRLLKTNNFPEFTGRVCPALCEAACTCGCNGDPVSVKDNELAIIEYAFANGGMSPRPPLVRTGKRVAVIGSGPSGLAAADQLNHRGHTVTVFEREDRPGGLMMYGIPNVKMDKGIIARRIRLMTDEGVRFLTGADVGINTDPKDLLSLYDAVLLCCGASEPRDLKVPGRDCAGILFAVDYLKAATKRLLDPNTPQDANLCAANRHVLVLGGGDTGNDCVGSVIREGCASVIQIEMMPKPPFIRAEDNGWPRWPRIFKIDYGQEEACALFGSDPRVFATTVKECIPDEQGKLKAVRLIRLDVQRDPAGGRMRINEIEGSAYTVQADMLLIAAGFTGCQNKSAAAFGVAVNARGNAATLPGSHRTDKEKVFAAGDMNIGQSLVVRAMAEGRAAAKEIDEFLTGSADF